MIKTKIVSEMVTRTVDVICDSCGKTCVGKLGDAEFMEMGVHWGFASKKDLELWEAQICEKCVDEKFGFIKFRKSKYDAITVEEVTKTDPTAN